MESAKKKASGIVSDNVEVRHLGLLRYQTALEKMQNFTDARGADCSDELWVLQHPAVYTLGQAGDPAHILDAGEIEIVRADRGGQVTYHGPGQLVIYVLVDLKRRRIGVKSLVNTLENTVIAYLRDRCVDAVSRADAPGVYVDQRKIAALGLRVRRGCSFHGLSLNVDMDLEPFSRINPCGYADMQVTQLRDLGIVDSMAEAGDDIARRLIDALAAPV